MENLIYFECSMLNTLKLTVFIVQFITYLSLERVIAKFSSLQVQVFFLYLAESKKVTEPKQFTS